MTHPIFQRYPLADEPVQTSVGPQPVPYHVYDAHAVLIGGTADLVKVQNLLGAEQIVPATTQSGRALMGIWAVDETQASHGPHSELQMSIYVSHQATDPVPDSPFALLRFLLSDSAARQMCHGLWNNTDAVVAYNREILGLPAQLARSTFEFSKDRVRFAFHDAKSGKLLVQGDVGEDRRPSLAATAALFRSFGFLRALRAAAAKELSLNVVNPIGPTLPRNADAFTVSSSDALVAQLVDPGRDHLTIAHPVYSQLDFQPTFIEHMRGFKMVYLRPE